MNTFELSRVFFDYCINNPDKIKTGNIALYYFIIDHCNRLGWPEKVGLPSYYAMSVLGIARYETYKSYLQTLVDCGFVNIVELSKNQYTSTVISLNGAKLKYSKPHSTAIGNQIDEQSESTPDSNSTIIKPKTLNLKQETLNGSEKPNTSPPPEPTTIPKQQKKTKEEEFDLRRANFRNEVYQYNNEYHEDMLNSFLMYWGEKTISGHKMKWELQKTFEIRLRLRKWKENQNKFSKPEEQRSLRAELK